MRCSPRPLPAMTRRTPSSPTAITSPHLSLAPCDSVISSRPPRRRVTARTDAHHRPLPRGIHRQTLRQRRPRDIQAERYIKGYVSGALHTLYTPLPRCAALTPVVVRFKSIGSAPIMKNNVFKITAGNKFQAVIVFLRGQLGLKAGEPLVSSGCVASLSRCWPREGSRSARWPSRPGDSSR